MFNKERKNLLSVIISIYDYKFQQNLLAVLKSIRAQSLDVEIVLSEQGDCKKSVYKEIAKEFNAKYILTKPDFDRGKKVFNIGRVRNAGALASTGRYLYFSDADIFIYNKNYFNILLEKSINSKIYNWYRPSMYRLSESTCNEFIKDYTNNISIDILNIPDICMVDYDKYTNMLRPISEGEYNKIILDQPFVCTKSEFEMINREGVDLLNTDEFVWKARFHYGGTFCSFSNFYKAAGYCELYYNWGLEDEDFHCKLRAIGGIGKIDRIVPNKSILHFEHSTKYNNNTYKRNIEIFKQRQMLGVDEIIKLDKNNKESFIASYIQNNKDVLNSFIVN